MDGLEPRVPLADLERDPEEEREGVKWRQPKAIRA